jgi:hypothetical protein
VSSTEDPLVLPYQWASGAIGGKVEFIVAVVDFNLKEKSTISIEADARDKDGKFVADLYSIDQMKDFWNRRLHSTDETLRPRLDYLDRYYLPSQNFSLNKGHRDYYLVLAGKMPIPRPITVGISVSVNGGDPQTIFLDIAEKKK